MLKRLVCYFAISIFLLSGSTALGQMQSPTTGRQAFGSFTGGPDTINLGNLNIHIEIPLFHKTGRGLDYNLQMDYDSSIWEQSSPSGSSNWDLITDYDTSLTPFVAGWNATVEGQQSGSGNYNYNSYTCATTPEPKYGSSVSGFVYKTPDGVKHSFSGTGTYDQCNTSLNTGFSIAASDGSGYFLTVNVPDQLGGCNATITDPSGRKVALLGLSGSLFSTRKESASDTNGNSISLSGVSTSSVLNLGPYKDSLGYTPIQIASTQAIGYTTFPKTLTYTDSNGSAQTITIVYTSYTIQTNFGVSGVSEYGPISGYYMISEIDYPDGSSYHIGYEATPGHSGNITGRIASVTLPMGGVISYAYAGIEADGSASGITRTLTDGGVTVETATYARSAVTFNSSGNGSSTTTVTDGYSNQTVIDFSESIFNFFETRRRIYSGSSSGTPVRTITTCYNSSASTCPNSSVVLPFSSIAVNQTLDNSLKSEVYSQYNPMELPTSISEYDYGASTPSRVTTTTYNTSLTNNILNRPSQVVVADGSGNTVSKVTSGYDTTTVQASHLSPPNPWTGSRGNLTTETVYVYPGTSTLTTTMTYDDTGSMVSMLDYSGNTSSIGYDTATNAYPILVTPPTPSSGVSLSASAVYDMNTGLVTSVTDSNSVATNLTYDSMLRLHTSVTTNPSTSAVTSSETITYPSYTETNVVDAMTSTQNAETDTLVDGFGRVSRVEVYDGSVSGTPWYQQDGCYDLDGRSSFQSYQYLGAGFSSTSKVCSGSGDTYAYDGIGRISTVTHSDSTFASYTYTGRATQTKDEGNNSGNTANVSRIRQYDGLGRLASLCEITGLTALSSGAPSSCGLDIAGTGYLTTYTYDVANRKVTTAQGSQGRLFTQDSLGRTISTIEPEVGYAPNASSTNVATTFAYSYNTTGLQTVRTKPKANQANTVTTVSTTSTTTQYDQVGRALTVTYSDGTTPTLTYTYDTAATGCTGSFPKGRLTKESSTNGTSNGFCYSNMGDVVSETSCTPGHCGATPYAQSFSYDEAGNLVTKTNAQSHTFTLGYTSASLPQTLTSSLHDATHPATVASMTYRTEGLNALTGGNGTVSTYTYDTQQRLNKIVWNIGGTNVTYQSGLSGDGSVLTEADPTMGSTTYTYDPTGRLATAVSSAKSYSYGYDRWGNRWNETESHGGSPSEALAINTTSNQITENNYDVAGNTVLELGQAFTYDAEGQLVTAGSATYVYDPEGNRVETQVSGGATTDYVYDVDGEAGSVVNPSTGAALRENIWIGGQKIALYSGSTTYFVHATPVGTVRGLSDMTNELTAAYGSYEFGDGFSFSGTNTDDLHFAGLAHDTETGLEHAWGRQYSSADGRWMVPDPYSGSYDPSNPQSFNRYAYAMNNPLALNDRSGLDGEGADPGGSSGGGSETSDGDGVSDGEDNQLHCCVPDMKPGPIAPSPGSGPGGGTPNGFGGGGLGGPGGGKQGGPGPGLIAKANKAARSLYDKVRSHPKLSAYNPALAYADYLNSLASGLAKPSLYFQGTISAGEMTFEWFTGTGSVRHVFGPGSIESQLMAEAPGTREAVSAYYRSGKDQGTFLFTGLSPIAAGFNPMAQFVGSFEYTIFHSAHGGLDVDIANRTSLWSAAYHRKPLHSRAKQAAMGSTYQVYRVHIK